MDYAYILNELAHISEAGTTVSQNGYNPAWNVVSIRKLLMNY